METSLSSNAGKRRGRNVHFTHNGGETTLDEGSNAPVNTSSTSNALSSVLIDNILPKAWVKPAWIDAFLDKIETCESIKPEEKRMYRKVLMRFVANVIDSSGIHPSDWTRVLRDYLLFISMNIDQIPSF